MDFGVKRNEKETDFNLEELLKINASCSGTSSHFTERSNPIE